MDKSQSTRWLVRNRDLPVVCATFFVALLAVFLVALPCGAAAQISSNRAEFESQVMHRGYSFGGERESTEDERRLRMLNADRQKTMVSDANQLLKLAAQLNAEIAAANPGELSAAQLKKIGVIEKLARKVREKMSTSVRGNPMNPGSYIHDLR